MGLLSLKLETCSLSGPPSNRDLQQLSNHISDNGHHRAKLITVILPFLLLPPLTPNSMLLVVGKMFFFDWFPPPLPNIEFGGRGG